MSGLEKAKHGFNSWLFRIMPANAANIKVSINVLNMLLMKSRTIQCNIMQITDAEKIDTLIEQIRNKRGINIHSRHQKMNYLSSLNAYKEYLTFMSQEASNTQAGSSNIVKNIEDISRDSANVDLFVSFTESCIYKYTRPSTLEYFDKHYVVRNWVQVYVQVVKCLFEDYPNKIHTLIGLNIGGKGRVDLADCAGADAMIAPRSITGDLYLETNESADNIVKKIRKLLDICEVDYENVVITYSTSKTTDAQSCSITFYENVKMSPSATDTSFYNWLTETQGVAMTIGRSYTWAINIVDKYVREHHVGYGAIQGTMDYAFVRETVNALFQTSEFVKVNQKQHNRFRAALKKYLQYLSDNSVEPKATEVIYADVDFEPYKKILLECFPKGFRISSRLDMGRFRTYWVRKYGTELDVDDGAVRKYISHITIPYQDFVYLPETMLDASTTERLLTYLSTCFKQGKVVVYFDAIYKEFQADFAGKRINNSDMLKSYLSFINDGRFYIHRSYLTIEADAEVNPADEVRDYLITGGVPVAVENLKAALSHIDEDKISWAVAGSNSSEFVRNRKGEYFHADIIRFTQSERDMIIELIQQSINDKEYMAGKELTDAIEVKLPAIMERYPFLTWLGLRDVIAYKLRDVFSFKGKIISAHGQDLSMSDVFAHFASSHEHFTLEQLNFLKRDLDTPIYFDAVYANSLRINRDEFVSRDREMFDVYATDAAIDRFCLGDYIALKEVNFFGSFPDAGFPWNGFLLEHYVSDFSRKYKLMHIEFTAGTTVGAIVKRSSDYETFDELLITTLADSNILLNEQNALQYLLDIGMIARRHYSGIQQILVKARQQRSKKGK